MKITDLIPGDVYELKNPIDIDISIQIGAGGDCGIFLGKCESDTFEKIPQFRILVNQKNLKKFWKKTGSYPLGVQLTKFSEYSYMDIGTQQKYKTALNNLDEMISIDDEEFKHLERLAAWETIHIINRVKDGAYADRAI